MCIANAALIAAAPELLEALKDAEAMLCASKVRWDIAEQRKHHFIKAAIAKAEGNA